METDRSDLVVVHKNVDEGVEVTEGVGGIGEVVVRDSFDGRREPLDEFKRWGGTYG